jgi:thymidylate synthase
MKIWLDLLQDVMLNGEDRPNRTGIDTRAVFGRQVRFKNTENECPIVTTKKFFDRQCFGEMAAFIQGYSSLEEFHKMGCTIWDANANSPYWLPHAKFKGDLGRLYGVQWRAWGSGLDQLSRLVSTLKTSPYDRRMIVTAWDPEELSSMCLPPCHIMFQCFVSNDKQLDLNVYMRSVDLFLGLPFDIAGYALLQRLIAKETGLISRELIFSLGDAHIYHNHFEAVETALFRTPMSPPKLVIDGQSNLFTFHSDQAKLENYLCYPAIKAEMAV